MELQLEYLKVAASETSWQVERAADGPGRCNQFQPKRPSRKPFPEHLPRERVVIPAPERRPRCGSPNMSKLGEDIRTSPDTGGDHAAVEGDQRTLAWMSHNRRLARDFELYARSVTAFIRLAMIRILLRRWTNPSLCS
jgi:hypothetical protein